MEKGPGDEEDETVILLSEPVMTSPDEANT
jgi:hypothetical protein